MVKNHLKRLAAPKTIELLRKERKFTIKVAPGAHPLDRSLPLASIIRDKLNYAKTRREIKYILNKKETTIDKKLRTDLKFAV